jgi:hypothetical protein
MQKNLLFGGALFAVAITAPSAFAVGAGVPFGFRETPIVNALANTVAADSLDYTRHECLDYVDADHANVTGYLWISSFQAPGTVVNSQINHILPNGYRMYARYQFKAEVCSDEHTCSNQDRRNYILSEPSIRLYIDPTSDTVLALQNCAVVVANNADDGLLGGATAGTGQMSETNALANGDLEVTFTDWAFTALGGALFHDLNNVPLVAPLMQFDGNFTRLQGLLTGDQLPEGSGNLFWRVPPPPVVP